MKLSVHCTQRSLHTIMPTTAERQALAFLAAVALLGGGARAWSYYQQSDQSIATAKGAAGHAAETVGDQLAAIDSARTTKRGAHGKGRGGGVRGSASSNSNARNNSSNFARKRKNDGKLEEPVGRSASEGLRGADIVIDADVATALQLQMLPRISPALAERIVANRDSLGTFGSLAALGRVRGMSADIRNQIRNLIVFTSIPRIQPPRVLQAQTDGRAESRGRLSSSGRTVTSRTKKRN
ncbi:MAG: helix-hairpin-helix domain-containing protein [Gemmatimonadaceae bacterium]